MYESFRMPKISFTNAVSEFIYEVLVSGFHIQKRSRLLLDFTEGPKYTQG